MASFESGDLRGAVMRSSTTNELDELEVENERLVTENAKLKMALEKMRDRYKSITLYEYALMCNELANQALISKEAKK